MLPGPWKVFVLCLLVIISFAILGFVDYSFIYYYSLNTRNVFSNYITLKLISIVIQYNTRMIKLLHKTQLHSQGTNSKRLTKQKKNSNHHTCISGGNYFNFFFHYVHNQANSTIIIRESSRQFDSLKNINHMSLQFHHSLIVKFLCNIFCFISLVFLNQK